MSRDTTTGKPSDSTRREELRLVQRLVSRPYSDWFGKGDTKEDVENVIAEHGRPQEVLMEGVGYMACVIYSDKVIVTGYDGGEYRPTFEFPRCEANAVVHGRGRQIKKRNMPGIPNGVQIKSSILKIGWDVDALTAYCVNLRNLAMGATSELESAEPNEKPNP